MGAEKAERAAISRVPRSKEQARASYDRLSRWYDALTWSERRFTDAGLDLLTPAPGEKILEIGYGTGHALVCLARAVGTAGRVYGVDISPGMRLRAESRLEWAGLSGRVELTTGDACALPFVDGSLDAIFMSFTLELFDTPEIPVLLSECWRVLASGGRIAVVSLAVETRPGFAIRMYEWAHARFPALVDCRLIRVTEALEAAGFQITATRPERTWGLPLELCLAVKT